MTTYDAIVIGAGQSGPSLAARLAQSGQRVALIEKTRLGGTCVNDGCIPTKTLVASARAAWVARNAARWGVTVPGQISVDMKAVKARKDAVVEDSRTSLSQWIGGTERLDLIIGEARFESATSVRVADKTLSAERFFIDCGGRPVVPDLPGIRDVPFLTNVDMMDVDFVPEHLVILGGSYIGLEFAQMYRRFGSKVTVIERSERLIPREDDAISAALLELLRDDAIEVHLSSEVRRVQRDGQDGQGVALELASGTQVRGSHLLLAIGRVPNTDTLNLPAIGVQLDQRGYIQVDDQLRSSQPHIWALGDCHGRGQFTHTSYNDYEIVAANLLDDDPRRVSDRVPAYALYTDPPLARIGLSREGARQSGKRVLVGHLPMTRVGRARERGETDGFLEALVDADSGRLLGATMLGIEADEAIHCLLDVMAAGLPYTAISRTMHIHPTVSELVPTLLQRLAPLA
ncbi:MAG: FAD-containing oxidoreductase [Polyangiales bacterium]